MKQQSIHIRHFETADWPGIWQMIEPVFRAGETYAFAREISEADAQKVWIDLPAATYVAHDDTGQLLGTYYIKANQPGLGSHVCNCGYIVSSHARGMGVASQMCEHSQQDAIARGFRAMQYNLVVSSNEGAIRLWLKHGFEIVGKLPGAFNHPKLGDIDALVMYKILNNKKVP